MLSVDTTTMHFSLFSYIKKQFIYCISFHTFVGNSLPPPLNSILLGKLTKWNTIFLIVGVQNQLELSVYFVPFTQVPYHSNDYILSTLAT